MSSKWTEQEIRAAAEHLVREEFPTADKNVVLNVTEVLMHCSTVDQDRLIRKQCELTRAEGLLREAAEVLNLMRPSGIESARKLQGWFDKYHTILESTQH